MRVDEGMGVELKLMLPEVKASVMKWVSDREGAIVAMVDGAIGREVESLDLEAIVKNHVEGQVKRCVESAVHMAVSETFRDWGQQLQKRLATDLESRVRAEIGNIIREDAGEK